MVTGERRIDRGRRLAREALCRIGEELREARLTAGLTQRQLGSMVGVSHAQISRIELGRARRVSYETLVVMASVLGLDLPLRAYPVGEPVRDQAQLALLARFRAALPAGLTWRTEVPIQLPGDRRAWDGVVGGPTWSLAVDGESRLRDVQAVARRVGLKARDDQRSVVILLVADTRHNRHVLRLAALELAGQFPVSGKRALADLRRGNLPTGSAIVLL